jgi:hypothetical protein
VIPRISLSGDYEISRIIKGGWHLGGLGPPIVSTVAVGYLIALAALWAALSIFRARSTVAA